MKLTVEADIPDRWVPYFCKLLRDMEYNGNVGQSRLLTFYADGDGDFHPKFLFDVSEVWQIEIPADVETRDVRPLFGSEDYFYDAG